MAAFLLGGIFFDRPVLALNSLAGAALLILAFDTNQLFTSGFQLSFAVVGAILVWQNSIFRVLLRPAETDPFLPRSLISRSRRFFERSYRLVAGGVSVSAAAWAGSLLLIVWYFYLVTPISLIANLTVVPIAFCVLAARPDVVAGRDIFARAFARFQQRKLESCSNDSPPGPGFCAVARRTRLC